jgi:hypothetical protein
MLHRQNNVRRLQAIGSEVQSNAIRLLILMPGLEVKAGTAGGEGVTQQPVRGTKPFSGADETTLKQRAGYPHLAKAGDGQNAVFLRIDLEPVA